MDCEGNIVSFLGRMFGEENETSIFAKRLRTMEEDKIIIYQTEDGQTQIDVRLENETVWLNVEQMENPERTDPSSQCFTDP